MVILYAVGRIRLVIKHHWRAEGLPCARLVQPKMPAQDVVFVGRCFMLLIASSYLRREINQHQRTFCDRDMNLCLNSVGQDQSRLKSLSEVRHGFPGQPELHLSS